MRVGLLLTIALSALIQFSGCDYGPARIDQIEADPAELAKCLFEVGDKDKNQILAADELRALPYIAGMTSAYDSNLDKQLSEQEIEARLASVVFDPRKALTPGECLVLRNGKPFSGAQVVLVPAMCLGDYLPVASGKTNGLGIVRLTMEEQNRPKNAPHIAGLIRPGLYRIEVTHPSVAVPSQYNAQSILGAEASAATLVKGPITVHLEF